MKFNSKTTQFGGGPFLRGRTGRAFTLIELLTVIAIIGILAAILIPTVGAVRESAYQAKCSSNVRQLVHASHIFADETGAFPKAEGMFQIQEGRRRSREEQMNWIMILVQGGYADRMVPGGDTDTLFFCPTAVKFREISESNANSYGINWHASGGWFEQRGNVWNMGRARDATQTAMIMDGHWNGSTYHTFVNEPGGIREPDYVHPPSNANEASAGINVGFVDGHVDFVRKSEIDEKDSDDVFWTGEFDQ